jgi:hypothetical protein
MVAKNFLLVLLVRCTANVYFLKSCKGIDLVVGGSGGGVGIVPPHLFFLRVERILYNIVLYFKYKTMLKPLFRLYYHL